MSELPAMRNEAQAIARLQNIFRSVPEARLHAVLRSWGAGGETTPMRPWDDRVEHAVDFLIGEGEIAELDSAPLAAHTAAPAAGTSRGALPAAAPAAPAVGVAAVAAPPAAAPGYTHLAAASSSGYSSESVDLYSAKMREWWDINGGLMIRGETPITIMLENSAREHAQQQMRKEFLDEFAETALVHMDESTLRMFGADGA